MSQPQFQIEFAQEEDGRWVVEIPDIPGALTYGATQEEASAAVQTLALRILSDQ